MQGLNLLQPVRVQHRESLSRLQGSRCFDEKKGPRCYLASVPIQRHNYHLPLSETPSTLVPQNPCSQANVLQCYSFLSLAKVHVQPYNQHSPFSYALVTLVPPQPCRQLHVLHGMADKCMFYHTALIVYNHSSLAKCSYPTIQPALFSLKHLCKSGPSTFMWQCVSCTVQSILLPSPIPGRP